MKKRIIGLAKEMVDDTTGVGAAFWDVGQYTVRLDQKRTTAIMRGYVSLEGAQAGKRPFTNIAVELEGVPTGEPDQWIYQAVTASDKHKLAGATPATD